MYQAILRKVGVEIAYCLKLGYTLMQKTKKINEQLAHLLKMIGLANALPIEPFLPTADSLMRHFYAGYTNTRDLPSFEAPEWDAGEWEYPTDEDQDNYEKARQETLEELKKQLREFAPKVYDHIFVYKRNADPAEQYLYEKYGSDPVEKYDEFLSLRAQLRGIAYECTAFYKEGKRPTFPRFSIFFVSRSARKQKMADTFFVIDENGLIDFESDLIRGLRKLEANRLRICPVCKLIYWAFRIDTKYCSEKCSNAFHQKKYLSDEERRRAYNDKRIETYRSKKEQKNGKERAKKNGTL